MGKKPIKTIKNQLLKEIEILKDKRGFLRAGLPRFSQFFSRDSLITSWQLLEIDPKISQKTLEILAKFQGKKEDELREEEPGRILHETDFKSRFHPERLIPFPYYGSVDSTPLFLILFGFFYEKTNDKNFLKRHFSDILSAVNWMINYGDKDNDLFLEYERKNPKGLFHQCWKDSWYKDPLKITPPVAIVEVQGYQYLALKKISKLSKILGDEELSKSLFKRAEDLKLQFNKKFWMKDKKYFCLALDGEKKKKKSITSNPGHLLFTGITARNKVDLVVKKLFQKNLWTPFGIRTHSTSEPNFDPKSYHLGSIWPHDNWIIAQGLKKLGYKKEYLKIKKALFQAYQKLGFLPELYGVVDKKIVEIPIACYPQAWATGALLNFLTSKF